MRTLSQILVDVNAYCDLEATAPTGTELATRTNYATRSVWEASAIAQFSEFHKIYEVDPGASSTVTLPANFRELMTAPKQYINGSWVDYEEIKPLDRFNKASTERYCYVLGNPAEGYQAVFNNLEANATISIDYQRYPSGFATLSNICELPDPVYVVSKTESYVLQSRSDDRFPIKDTEASVRLQNMVGREMKTPGGGINSVKKTGIASYSIG